MAKLIDHHVDYANCHSRKVQRTQRLHSEEDKHEQVGLYIPHELRQAARVQLGLRRAQQQIQNRRRMITTEVRNSILGGKELDHDEG